MPSSESSHPLASRATHWRLLHAACFIAVSGCSDTGINKVAVEGDVLIKGAAPEAGEIRFIPIEGTKGPISAGVVNKGHFRIDARGGVPIGKHRVEIAAYRKTGKKIPSPRGGGDMIEEKILVVPTEYTTAKSPLVVSIDSSTAKQLDITIP